ITTDHGTTQVKTPSKCIGDRQTTTNLRYKHGRNLQYETKDVLAFRDPSKAGLPKPNVSYVYLCEGRCVFMLSQQLQPLCELLPQYLSARRNIAGRNAGTGSKIAKQVIPECLSN